MKRIQVILDSRLLRATDRVARRMNLTRSALIRSALREHLRTLKIRELEGRDRNGYQAIPQKAAELPGWESEAVWPKRRNLAESIHHRFAAIGGVELPRVPREPMRRITKLW